LSTVESPLTVLVVNEDRELRERLALLLTDAGAVVVTSDTMHALETFYAQPFDVILIEALAARRAGFARPVPVAPLDRHTHEAVRRVRAAQVAIETDPRFSDRSFVFALRRPAKAS